MEAVTASDNVSRLHVVIVRQMVFTSYAGMYGSGLSFVLYCLPICPTAPPFVLLLVHLSYCNLSFWKLPCFYYNCLISLLNVLRFVYFSKFVCFFVFCCCFFSFFFNSRCLDFISKQGGWGRCFCCRTATWCCISDVWNKQVVKSKAGQDTSSPEWQLVTISSSNTAMLEADRYLPRVISSLFTTLQCLSEPNTKVALQITIILLPTSSVKSKIMRVHE